MLDGFPAVMRLQPLKGYDAFGNVFRTGRRFSNGRATAMVIFRSPVSTLEPCTSPATEQQIVYFGVTAKKRTRPAVLRNRIKRLLRESIWQIAGEHDRTEPTPFREIVVIWNAVPPQSSMLGLETVRVAVRDVLEKAAGYYQRKQQ